MSILICLGRKAVDFTQLLSLANVPSHLIGARASCDNQHDHPLQDGHEQNNHLLDDDHHHRHRLRKYWGPSPPPR